MVTFARAGSRLGITIDNITRFVLCAHLQFGTTTGIVAAIELSRDLSSGQEWRFFDAEEQSAGSGRFAELT